ncbi:MAG: hydrogenase maturation protease, partial [Burkholderiales bacterium]|nr:hydrogenase maturation protease [Burkholderiales bacterium]
VALGNDWRGDDGAGPALALRLAARLPGCVVLEPKDTMALAEALCAAPVVVVLDAASSGAAPGTLHRVDPDSGGLRSSAARHSSHATDLLEALSLVRALGRSPGRLAVYALEGERFGEGTGLSPALERALAPAAEAIAGEILREEPTDA